MSQDNILQIIKNERVIAVLRPQDHESAEGMIDAFTRGGIKIIELTTSIPDWEKLLPEIVAKFKDKAVIGMGTITSPDQVASAVKAGAQFIVSPYLQPDVIKAAKEEKVPVIPGALTASEIAEAYRLGADMVKVFPASSVGGPSYIKALLAPVPSWELIPTGGVTPDDAQAYLDAGAVAVGMGSNLAPKDKIRFKDWNYVAITVKQFIDSLT